MFMFNIALKIQGDEKIYRHICSIMIMINDATTKYRTLDAKTNVRSCIILFTFIFYNIPIQLLYQEIPQPQNCTLSCVQCSILSLCQQDILLRA